MELIGAIYLFGVYEAVNLEKYAYHSPSIPTNLDQFVLKLLKTVEATVLTKQKDQNQNPGPFKYYTQILIEILQ